MDDLEGKPTIFGNILLYIPKTLRSDRPEPSWIENNTLWLQVGLASQHHQGEAKEWPERDTVQIDRSVWDRLGRRYAKIKTRVFWLVGWLFGCLVGWLLLLLAKRNTHGN